MSEPILPQLIAMAIAAGIGALIYFSWYPARARQKSEVDKRPK